MKVLIADDDADFRHMLEKMVSGFGYHPVVCKDGDEAWAELQLPDSPRLILMDWSMGDSLSGIQICRRLRLNQAVPPRYSIMLTGRFCTEDLVDALEAGADDYLVKPFQREELCARLGIGARTLARYDGLLKKARPSPSAEGGSQPSGIDFSRVLVAEDDPVSRTVIVENLIGWGFEVVVAENGEQAWKVLQQEGAPMIAILDWMMPKMTGVDVCRLARQQLSSRPCYLLLLTAKASVADMLSGLEAGADDYLTKPFNAAELKAKVNIGVRLMRVQAQLGVRAESAESRYQSIFESVNQGIYQMDADARRLQLVNPAFAEMLGYASPTELIDTVTDFKTQLCEDVDSVKSMLLQLEKHDVVTDVELCLQNRDNRLIWSQHRLRLVRDGSGTALRIEGSCTDITIRRQREEARLREFERTKLLNQITRLIAHRTDLESIFAVVLDTLETQLGIDVAGTSLVDPAASTLTVVATGSNGHQLATTFGLAPGAAVPLPHDVLQNGLKNQTHYWTEAEFASIFENTGRPASLIAVPLRVGGKLMAVLHTVRCQIDGFDQAEREFLQQLAEHVSLAAHQAEIITDLRHANQELKKSQEKIIQQERLRALGEMATGIAHDFNNALVPILGYADLMIVMPDILNNRDETISYLKTIQTSAKDAAAIVRRMREFYRQRDVTEELQPINLSEIVEQAIEITEPKWRNQALSQGVEIDLVPQLQDVPNIKGHESELRELLTNLIFNATDAILQKVKNEQAAGRELSNGRVTILTRTKDAPRPGQANQVVLEVKDTGTGMSEEVYKRCMEPFFSTKGEHGTGMGLAMVFGIISRHQGTIVINNKPGRELTFIMTFPSDEKISKPSEIVSNTFHVSPRHILIVDDEKDVRKVFASFLKLDGHTCVLANSGQEALELFQSEVFDLVLTDRTMPGMRGDQLAATIKQRSPDTPVIMVTGFGTLMKDKGEYPPGVDEVLSKPVNITQLRETIHRQFSPAEGTPEHRNPVEESRVGLES